MTGPISASRPVPTPPHPIKPGSSAEERTPPTVRDKDADKVATKVPTPDPTPTRASDEKDGPRKRPSLAASLKQLDVPVAAAAATIVGQFDRDGSGGIDVATESARFTGSRQQLTTHSVERMARLADLQGNHDGSASTEEVEALMLTYDVGIDGAVAGDGSLGLPEYQTFLEDFGPETSTSTFRPDVWIRTLQSKGG